MQSEIRTQLYGFAYRVGFNRLVAGVHFPIDLIAGAHLGRFLGIAFIKAAYCVDPKSKLKIEIFISDTAALAQSKLSELPQLDKAVFKHTSKVEVLALATQITPTIGAVALNEMLQLFP